MSVYGTGATAAKASASAASADGSPQADGPVGSDSSDAAAPGDAGGTPAWVWPVVVLLVVGALVLGSALRLRGRRRPGTLPSSAGRDEMHSATRGSRQVTADDDTKEV
jgi:hypothetical protein